MVILEPPAAPVTNISDLLSLSRTIVGHIDERGLFPGLMKFEAEGGRPNSFVTSGEEKSSISLFIMMPVVGDIITEP